MTKIGGVHKNHILKDEILSFSFTFAARTHIASFILLSLPTGKSLGNFSLDEHQPQRKEPWCPWGIAGRGRGNERAWPIHPTLKPFSSQITHRTSNQNFSASFFNVKNRKIFSKKKNSQNL